MGEVANRRAWFDVTKLTPEVLHLYKQPLKVQGWDLALLEVRRTHHVVSSAVVALLLCELCKAALHGACKAVGSSSLLRGIQFMLTCC